MKKFSFPAEILCLFFIICVSVLFGKLLIDVKNVVGDKLEKFLLIPQPAIVVDYQAYSYRYRKEIEGLQELTILKSEEDMDKFYEKVVNYSTFEYRSFIKIMKEIIKIYEGENFIYKEIRYFPQPIRKSTYHKRSKVLFLDKRKTLINQDIDISKLYAKINW